MKTTIIVLVVLAVLVLFYGQSFMPAPAPASSGGVQAEMPVIDANGNPSGVPEAIVEQQ